MAEQVADMDLIETSTESKDEKPTSSNYIKKREPMSWPARFATVMENREATFELAIKDHPETKKSYLCITRVYETSKGEVYTDPFHVPWIMGDQLVRFINLAKQTV